MVVTIASTKIWSGVFHKVSICILLEPLHQTAVKEQRLTRSEKKVAIQIQEITDRSGC